MIAYGPESLEVMIRDQTVIKYGSEVDSGCWMYQFCSFVNYLGFNDDYIDTTTTSYSHYDTKL